MQQLQQPEQIQKTNLNKHFIEDIKQLKKNKQQIEKLLLDLKDVKIQEEQQMKELELSKQVKRRMLQTNLSDRRALGGLLGTAILGIIGLAVGLNVIGIIIGGIIGALLGSYAGKRIKEKALKKKKLMNINLHVIKFAAYAQHLIDEDLKVATIEEIRTIMALLLSECKMVIIFCQKFQKQERRQVIKIQKKLIKNLKKNKVLYATYQMYWIVKQWSQSKETNLDLALEEREQIEKEIAGISFNFLRPLLKLMTSNRRMLNSDQKKLEQKINKILLSSAILDLKEKYLKYQQLQVEAEEEFLEQIYREVELKQLKAIMEDQIAQELLKEDEINAQQQQSQSEEKINQQIPQDQNQQEKEINVGQCDSHLTKNVENTKYVVWNYQSNSSGGLNQPSLYSNQQSLVFNQPQCPNPNQFQSTNNKSRLIDIIQMASHQKQQEEDFASYMSQKQVTDQVQSHQGKINNNQNSQPRILLFEKIDKNRFQNDLFSIKAEKCQQTEIDKEIYPIEITKYQSSDSLNDDEKINIDNKFNIKTLSTLNQQNAQQQEQIKINNDQSDKNKNCVYIPQKFLSNNGEEDNGLNTFMSHIPSNSDINQKSNQQQILNNISLNNLKNNYQNVINNENKETNLNIHKENNLTIKICELQKPQTNNNIRNSFIQESKFESHTNDPANYQTYVEEGNRSTKKTAQKVYQRKYQVNKNFQLRQVRQSNGTQDFGMNEEELQAAIQELKFDSQMLNQNQDIKAKQLVEQKIHRIDASPAQSFVRNKKGDVFLKMNSFDSLIISQNPSNNQGNHEQKINTNTNQIDLQTNPNQLNNHDHDVREVNHLPQNYINNESESQRVVDDAADLLEKRKNQQNQLTNLKENEVIIEEKNMYGNNLNNIHASVLNNQINQQKDQKYDSKTLDLQLKNEEKSKRISMNQKQPAISQNQIEERDNYFRNYVHTDIENSIYYSKDDQENIENVVLSKLGSSQIKQNTDNKTDNEIEQKLIKLKELDEENPEKIWEKVISKDRIIIYKKQIPNNPCVMVRAEAYIGECSQDEVFQQIYYEKNRKKWDKVTLGFSVIESLGDMQDIIYFYIDPGFGVTKRDFLQKRAVRKDYPSKGEITIVFFSTTHPSFPEKKGSIRAISHIAAYVIRPVKEGPKNCHLTIITQTDVKGQIPKYIVNFLSARAPAKWIESMKKGVFDHRKLKN